MPQKRAGRIAVLFSIAAACGQVQESTVGGPVAAVAPPSSRGAAAPVAPAPPAAAPAAPATAAADSSGPLLLEPPGGALIAQTRGQARLQAGRTGVLVALPDMPPEQGNPAECRRRGPVVALGYPLGSVAQRQVVGPSTHQCDGESPDPIAFVLLGEEAVAVDCSFPHNLSWACTLQAPFGPARPSISFGFPTRQNTAVVAAGFATHGDVVFAAVATTTGQIVGFVSPPTGEAARGLLATGGAEGTTFVVEPRGPAEVAVTWMRGSAGPANRLVMGADARPAGPPERVDRPVALRAGLRVEAQREDRADPHVMAGPAAGPLSPVGGIDAAAATFGPALAEIAPGRWVIAWSEGMRRDTRIRAARFDPTTRALAGPVADLSTAGREGGWVTLSAHGGHAVVMWNERAETGWEIRAAELR